MPALAPLSESPSARAAAIVRLYAHPRDQALLLALLEYAPSEKGRTNLAHKVIHAGDFHHIDGDSRCLGQVADFFWRNVILPGNAAAEPFIWKLDPEIIANGSGAFPIPPCGLEVTRVAHIIPFSLRASTGTTSGHLPSIWSALECFGGVDLGSLMHGGISSLDNVITLSATVHRYFTELQVALEPLLDTPNTYTVRTWGKVAPRLGLPKTVKLASGTAGAPPPNPAYLALHCAICRVLWASARAEELKDVLDDLEEVALLAADGSSANLINIAIYRSLAFSRADA
ncbi:hypothetical protein TRAPUB_10969 [Trametes pubescens]|uniref:HNH nuclease domain-containing protein n=1 Tax=Trametes pubescens TaxID=154538 RepID=A0A1M2VY93_TRAPU|nr:hypothetical protein TRAPUB_10969 [Trametes pubescens]